MSTDDAGLTPTVQSLATWIPVTRGAIADGQFTRAILEYRLTGPAPLTLRERITGYRRWTASNGVKLTIKVSWRGTLQSIRFRAARRIRRALSIRRFIHDRVSPHGEYCLDDD